MWFAAPALRLASVARACAARSSFSTPPLIDASQTKGSSLAVRPPIGCYPFCLAPARKRERLSWGSVPYSTIRCAGYSLEVPPSSTAHVYGFSPSSRASFRLILSRLISSRKRSWGSPFRGFPSNSGLKAHRLQVPLLSFPRWPPRPSLEHLGTPRRRLGSTSGACSLFESVRGTEAR